MIKSNIPSINWDKQKHEKFIQEAREREARYKRDSERLPIIKHGHKK